MLKWSIKKLTLDLKFTWKISRGSSNQKSIYLITVNDGSHSATGEVAGITAGDSNEEILINQFTEFAANSTDKSPLNDLLKLPTHLRFGIDSAWTHLQAKKNHQSVAEYLNTTPQEQYQTSFSIPILPEQEIQEFIQEYNLNRFSSIKIKVGYEKQAEACLELASHYSGPIRIDANEAFATAAEVIQFYKKLEHLPIEFIEQPLPRTNHSEYLKLKAKLPCPIIADESLQDGDVTEGLAKMFDGINMKLMKAGTYQQGLKQLNQAKQLGLKTMIGCMVETSLGISSALNIAENIDFIDLDGFLFFKEDPFNSVSERNGILKNNL